MPDDKPDFTAAQTKHAQDIKTRRTISRITGLTPNQVRNGLRSTDVISGPAGGNPNVPEGTVPVSLNVAPLPSPTMQFDPRPFANAPGPGQVAAPVMPDVVGTATTPYEMGENRTTTDPIAADDTWTRGTGPTPSTPVTGTDGVILTNPRYVSNGDGTGTLYTRRVEADTLGAILTVGAELATPIP